VKVPGPMPGQPVSTRSATRADRGRVASRSRSTASRPIGSIQAEPPANRPGSATRNRRRRFQRLLAPVIMRHRRAPGGPVTPVEDPGLIPGLWPRSLAGTSADRTNTRARTREFYWGVETLERRHCGSTESQAQLLERGPTDTKTRVRGPRLRRRLRARPRPPAQRTPRRLRHRRLRPPPQWQTPPGPTPNCEGLTEHRS